MSGSVTVLKNSTVTYTIEKEGYTTVTNTVVVSEDTSTTVTMDLALVTLTIEPDPSDATVTLTAAGYTQSGNSISVAPGTTVNYSVSKEGYTTATGSEVCTINRTINCTLESAGVDISITMNWESGFIYTGTYEAYNNNGTKIGEFVVSTTAAGSSTIVVNSLDLPNNYDPEEYPEILYDSDFYIVDDRASSWFDCSNEVNCEYVVGTTSEGQVMFKILDKTNPVVSFTYANNDKYVFNRYILG